MAAVIDQPFLMLAAATVSLALTAAASAVSPADHCLVGGPKVCPTGQYCGADFNMADATCPVAGKCRPLPSEGGDVTLALPVPSGARVFCTQGVLQPDGSTHASCSDDRRFALDLASSAFEPPLLVLASADGVAYGWGDCRSTDLNHDPPDATCNLGLGNVVRVQHPKGLYTQYAHLSSILIEPGQPVKRGEPIGVEGNSGAAGSKHIHFSLHAGDASRLAPTPSLPMRRLRLRGGRLVDSLSMRCNEATADGGPAPAIAYVSDNVPLSRPPRIGFAPPQRYMLESAAGKIFDPATRGPAVAELRRHPDEPLAAYWLAVALELDGNRDAALPLFRSLADSLAGPAWVRRWSSLRIADMEVAGGRTVEARRALARALEGVPLYDIDFRRFADYVRRELEWLERHPGH
jgi:hypothetical protein